MIGVAQLRSPRRPDGEDPSPLSAGPAGLGWIEARNVRDRIFAGQAADTERFAETTQLNWFADSGGYHRRSCRSPAVAGESGDTATMPIVFVQAWRSGRPAGSSKAWRGRAATSPGLPFRVRVGRKWLELLKEIAPRRHARRSSSVNPDES